MIILGAGLAGLSAAYHLADSVVYEGSAVVGGHAKSNTKNGFTFDEGIHVLHTKNEYVLSLLDGPAHAGLASHEREAWIYHYGTLTRYPFQANTYGLPLEVVKECLTGFIQNDFPNERFETYADWLYYQFGRGITDRFMIPYSIKFWGVHPRELTTEWVSVRHPRPSLDEVISGALGDQKKGFGVNATFHYPQRGGFGAIGEALAEAVGRQRIRLGMRATRIDLAERKIEFNGGELVLPYRALISTIPLPDLVAITADLPAPIRAAADQLRATSILAVNLGIDRPNLTEKHWIYYPEEDYLFFRVSFPMNKAAGMAPAGTSSIAAEIAHGNGRSVDRSGVVPRVVEDLRRSGVLQSSDQVVFQDTIDIRYAYIIHDKQRKPAVRAIRAHFKEHEVYPCGRYGDWGYLWSDEAILSGRRTAVALRRRSARKARVQAAA